MAVGRLFLTESRNMGKDVYVTKGKRCFYSTADATISYMEVPQLKSNQREADPRIAFHAIFASSTEETSYVCIVTDDTDIYITCCYMCLGISVGNYTFDKELVHQRMVLLIMM